LVDTEVETETKVRVHDWSDGVLGITFPLQWDGSVPLENDLSDFPGWDDAISTATASDKFIAALEDRPESHLPSELASTNTTARTLAPPVTDGTAGADTLVANGPGPYHISGRGGNDDITGSDGGDVIDGGTGSDVMQGGRGNDVYYVDHLLDQVIETVGGGFDKVFSSINYQLGQYVEHCTLQGNAISATGNGLRNTLEGNGLNNTLTGGDGNDTLVGNGGDDTLNGGNGGDGYVYEFGDGRDTIVETGTDAASKDVIVLAGSLIASDVNFVRNPDHALDLILTFIDGGSLTVLNYFAASGPNIERLEFTTGAVWDATELSARAAAANVSRNNSPIAYDDVFVFAGDGSATIALAALVDNDIDADGDQLSVTALTNVVGGQAVLDGNGNVIVTKSSAGDGNVSFDYRISDGHGGSSQASFGISLVHNEAPVISSTQLASVIEDRVASGRVNATDADHDTLIFRVKSGAGPTKGTVNVKDDGTFTYTPKANANGGDSFTLTVSDGLTGPVEHLFNLTIAAVNDAPVARIDKGFSVKAGQSIKIAAATLLKNDTDIDGDHLSLASVSLAKGGMVTKAADGSVTFKANAGYAGQASFNYTVSDGHGGLSTSTVTLQVTPTSHIITGTAGKDILYGTHGNDIFVGKGSSDTFVFRPINGHDQINDFQTGDYRYGAKDVLDLRHNGFTGYDDLIDNIHQTKAGALISLHDGGSILLKGVHEHALAIDNFRI
jgi:VCBS repeat-containing protein